MPVIKPVIKDINVTNLLAINSTNFIDDFKSRLKQSNAPQQAKTLNSKPFVVLIHGLHQNAWIMTPLARHLQKKGFQTYQHDYYSLRDSIDKHSDSLNVWLLKNHSPEVPIHLVGHSLGGLVMRNFIHRFPQWKIANCVTLGTPHQGSTTAHYSKKWVSPLVGNSYDKALDGKALSLKEGVNLGVIAGNVPYGLGQVFLNYHSKKFKYSNLKGAHDGTVYISETKLPQAADHIILPVSHTGMLINQKVAEQTAYFLKHGQFDHDK